MGEVMNLKGVEGGATLVVFSGILPGTPRPNIYKWMVVLKSFCFHPEN